MTPSSFDHPENRRVSVARWMVEATKDDDGSANWNAAALLAQLTWWCSPSERTGKLRVVHQHSEHFWLVRADDEWATELGMSAKTLSRLRRRLTERGLIECKRMSDKGRPVMHWRRLFADDQVDEKSGHSVDQVDQVSTSEVDQVSSQSRSSPLSLEKSNKTEVLTDARSESSSRFEAHFWPVYPARDGKKLDKKTALEQWHKLSIDDQRAAVKGARHYATSGQRAKDAHRWLRDRCFEDWQTPAVPSTNGNGHSNDAGPWLVAWEEVVAGARRHGRNDEPDWSADATERTVRAVGWGTICESVAGSSGIGPLRAQFRQTWQHHMTGVG